MWLFTRQGFISAVENRDNPETIVIRARDPEHLREMFPTEPILETEESDYPIRLYIERARFADWLARQAYDLDYTNFKDSIPSDQETYHDACVAVWEQMQALEKRHRVD